MIELYLILTIASAQITSHSTQTEACQSFDAATQKVYKEVIDRRGVATITEGTCQAVQQFKAK